MEVQDSKLFNDCVNVNEQNEKSDGQTCGAAKATANGQNENADGQTYGTAKANVNANEQPAKAVGQESGKFRGGEQFNNYVKRTLASGIKPIEIKFQPIADCYSGEAFAYRLQTVVNSVVTGVLYPSDYFQPSVDGKLLLNLSLRTLKKAVSLKNKLNDEGFAFKFLTVRFPSDEEVLLDGFYYKLKSVFDDERTNIENAYIKNAFAGSFNDGINNGTIDGVTDSNANNNATFNISNKANYKTDYKAITDKLVIEFDERITDLNGDDALNIFQQIRSLGLKVAVSSYGGKNFAMEKLIKACPDILFTDEEFAKLSDDREKSGAISPLIAFPESLGAAVIADGVDSDEQLRKLRSAGLKGFIPTKNYKGVFDVPHRLLDVNDLFYLNDEKGDEGDV